MYGSQFDDPISAHPRRNAADPQIRHHAASGAI